MKWGRGGWGEGEGGGRGLMLLFPSSSPLSPFPVPVSLPPPQHVDMPCSGKQPLSRELGRIHRVKQLNHRECRSQAMQGCIIHHLA